MDIDIFEKIKKGLLNLGQVAGLMDKRHKTMRRRSNFSRRYIMMVKRVYSASFVILCFTFLQFQDKCLADIEMAELSSVGFGIQGGYDETFNVRI